MQRNHRQRPTTFRARATRSGVVLVTAAVAATGLTGIAGAAGAAAGTHEPAGHINVIRQVGGDRVLVRGWADDADTSASARVVVRVDRRWRATLTANGSRPDVAARYPYLGSHRGYQAYLPVAAGVHRICALVIDYPSRAALYRLGCVQVGIDFNPTGKITSITAPPGSVRVSGWAFDPSRPATALVTSLRLDDHTVATTVADLPRSDVAVPYPRAGRAHGFAYLLPVTEGVHSICVKATNVGLGVSLRFACIRQTISFSPRGRVSGVAQVPGGVSVTGDATDPDTATPVRVTITSDGTPLGTLTANQRGHGFQARYLLPGTRLAPGTRTICALAHNLGRYGHDRVVGCVRHTFDWNPAAGLSGVRQHSPGATVTGWAADPDTAAAINVYVLADGRRVATVTARQTGGSHPGHGFTTTVPLADGKHSVCAVAVNTRYGSANSAPRCTAVTLAFEPYGAFESVARALASTNVLATGWTIDPDTTAAVPVQVRVDGGGPATAAANRSRPDIAARHPGTGTAHGFAVSLPAGTGEHRVCVQAVNILGGSGTTSLGCRTLNATHPVVPSSPTGVSAIAGYGGARVVWTAPSSDGGAPWSAYAITAAPGGTTRTVVAGIRTVTMLGLRPSTRYAFAVVAINVAGRSPAGTSAAVTTDNEPPAQTSPAPISTSRYIRNVSGSSGTDLARLRSEGAADARANPSGHGYLIVLAVGGQDESRAGVILSATIRYVSYADIVKNLDAYVDGYASQQRPSAPLTIAIATNNDIDVSYGSGVHFADRVVDPVLAHAAAYPGITIAGSDDMEPGFRAGYAASRGWLLGYLAATRAPFIFTGSADGCAWTTTNRACNNGWTMSGLFTLAGGASPIRIVDLPQVYNSTMAQQWRYISLTGVRAGLPKINFGGALTEWTACSQAQSCGSLTGNAAWTAMWAQLRAEPSLRPQSLPYSTDLRIDS